MLAESRAIGLPWPCWQCPNIFSLFLWFVVSCQHLLCRRHDTQYNNTQHNDTCHWRVKCDTQHNVMFYLLLCWVSLCWILWHRCVSVVFWLQPVFLNIECSCENTVNACTALTFGIIVRIFSFTVITYCITAVFQLQKALPNSVGYSAITGSVLHCPNILSLMLGFSASLSSAIAPPLYFNCRKSFPIL